MTRDFFKDGYLPEDFGEACLTEWETTKERPIGSVIADRANAILKAELEKAVEVFQKRSPAVGKPYSLVWAEYQTDNAAINYRNTGHSARLVRIEEIK